MLKYRQELIAIELVDLPAQSNKSRNPLAIIALAADIGQNGLLNPITVFAQSNRFEVIAGATRLLACRHAGLTHIPAQILDHAPDESERTLIALAENDHRHDFTPGERFDLYAKLIRVNGWTREELARHVGKSVGEISRLFGTADRLPPDLRERFLGGTLPASVGYALARAKTEEELRRLLSLYEGGQLDRDGIEKAVAAKSPASAKGQKVVVQFNGWTLTLVGPGAITPDSLAEFLKLLDRATESARKQGLPVTCIERLLKHKPSAN